MRNPLENYLRDVSEHLSSLPAPQRNEELREMRQHLLNAIIVNQEMGQPPDKALQKALADFGAPQELGESLVWAWRRRDRIDSRNSFCGALLCMVGLLNFLLGPISPVYSWQGAAGDSAHPWLYTILLYLGVMVGFGIVGVISGIFFPKRACLAALFMTALGFSLGTLFLVRHWLDFALIGCAIAFLGTALVWSAQVGSRWRMRGKNQLRDASIARRD